MLQATVVNLIGLNSLFTQQRENSSVLKKLRKTNTLMCSLTGRYAVSDRTFLMPTKHIYTSKKAEYLFKIFCFFFLFCMYFWQGDNKKKIKSLKTEKFIETYVNRETDKCKKHFSSQTKPLQSLSLGIFKVTPLRFSDRLKRIVGSHFTQQNTHFNGSF